MKRYMKKHILTLDFNAISSDACEVNREIGVGVISAGSWCYRYWLSIMRRPVLSARSPTSWKRSTIEMCHWQLSVNDYNGHFQNTRTRDLHVNFSRLSLSPPHFYLFLFSTSSLCHPLCLSLSLSPKVEPKLFKVIQNCIRLQQKTN